MLAECLSCLHAIAQQCHKTAAAMHASASQKQEQQPAEPEAACRQLWPLQRCCWVHKHRFTTQPAACPMCGQCVGDSGTPGHCTHSNSKYTGRPATQPRADQSAPIVREKSCRKSGLLAADSWVGTSVYVSQASAHRHTGRMDLDAAS